MDNILQLDKNRCRVRGCGSTYNLEVHHIIPRSQKDSSNEKWNLITLCQIHHLAVTHKKKTDIEILVELVYKHDFRWGKALAWHQKRKPLKDIKNAKRK